jgi:heme exporter protein B
VLLRERRFVVGSLGFSVLLVVLSSFAFREVGLRPDEVRLLLPGLLWTLFLFSGVSAVNHSALAEERGRAAWGTLLTGLDPGVVFLAKWVANSVYLFCLGVVLLLALSFFLGVSLAGVFLQLLLLLLLGTIGFTALGTVFALIAVTTESREILLPILLFTLLLPLLIAEVVLTKGVLSGGGIGYTDFWFVLLVAFDLIGFSLSFVLYEYALID